MYYYILLYIAIMQWIEQLEEAEAVASASQIKLINLFN